MSELSDIYGLFLSGMGFGGVAGAFFFVFGYALNAIFNKFIGRV